MTLNEITIFSILSDYFPHIDFIVSENTMESGKLFKISWPGGPPEDEVRRIIGGIEDGKFVFIELTREEDQ